MAQKSSYTDLVHQIFRDAEESLSLDDVIARLLELESENPPKSPRSTVRSAIRASGVIQPAGKNRFAWLPQRLRGARVRHTVSQEDFESRTLRWDTDLLVALWPAFSEPEKRRERGESIGTTDDGREFTFALEEEEEAYFTPLGTEFWAWLSEKGAEPGDDLIFTIIDSGERRHELRWVPRSGRSVELIAERNRAMARRMESFLTTCRDGLAKPREIAADLLASHSYHDSVPPLGLSSLLPEGIADRFGRAVSPDNISEEKASNVIPFPNRTGSEPVEVPIAEWAPGGGSVEFDIPRNTGQELPDDRAYREAFDLLIGAAAPSSALAIHSLSLSRLCSPAYAILSKTSEFRGEALELAGQSVLAAERRIAHGLIESLVSGEEFPVEEALANYLEARCFLSRALWHAGCFEEALEQAMHCFEIDPEEPTVRADLFVMLFESDRHEMVIDLLDSYPSPSTTEDLYHRALAALLDDPESKDSMKKLRKAVSHNPYLASLFLGEDPKKAKRSSVEEGDLYEGAFGYLWRREDQIFDLLEEIVLARR